MQLPPLFTPIRVVVSLNIIARVWMATSNNWGLSGHPCLVQRKRGKTFVYVMLSYLFVLRLAVSHKILSHEQSRAKAKLL